MNGSDPADRCDPALFVDAQDFTYDVMGNLLSARNRFAQVGRTYFPNGALKTDTLRIAKTDLSAWDATHQYVNIYAYNLDGQRIAMSRPSQLGLFATTTYGYDAQTGALSTLHEKAIYLVEGRLFQVERLDVEGRKAYVRQVDCDYYTDAITYSPVTILDVFQTESAAVARSSCRPIWTPGLASSLRRSTGAPHDARNAAVPAGEFLGALGVGIKPGSRERDRGSRQSLYWTPRADQPLIKSAPRWCVARRRAQLERQGS